MVSMFKTLQTHKNTRLSPDSHQQLAAVFSALLEIGKLVLLEENIPFSDAFFPSTASVELECGRNYFYTRTSG
jgi:hypothetical protein